MKAATKHILIVLFMVLAAVSGLLYAQEAALKQTPELPSLDQKIPVDPKVTTGTLANGLRYIIREHRQPQNRAELRLVVNAGSVLEEDDQQGLAHFLEHMAFNGSRNFDKQELIRFMESIGMRFGPDLNAMTSFDETIYMLTIPTDSEETLVSAFQILEDWAHGLTLEEDEIERERGVIIEEWRLGRGAQGRMLDKQFPIMFRGSRYAERLPIGKKKVIESFEYEELRRFYRDWYRPDLMAVIAVGDFEAGSIEALVKKNFNRIPRPNNPKPRPVYPLPDHEETLYAIATDKENTRTTVAVYHKHPLSEQDTVGSYRRMLTENLYNGMLNRRFVEMTQDPQAPFLMAFSNKGLFIRSKEFYGLTALVKEEGIERGLEALFIESERVDRFGFTESELERQKADMLRAVERAYTERENTRSSMLADEYVRHFLQGEPIPGIEYEFGLHKRFIPEITLEEINRVGREWITENNRVILVNAPEKEGFQVPSEDALLAVVRSVADKEIQPYEDEVTDVPLLTDMPKPGEIVTRTNIEELQITEWTLSNGIRVVLRPTDFKEDEILFRATSPGGTSLAGDEDFMAASTAAQVIAAGGLGEFSSIELGKTLSGKVANVRPYISSLAEGLMGSASPQDLETLFQLIYLTFTSPRADAKTFEVMKIQRREQVKNRSSSPTAVFFDALMSVLSQNHPRSQPLTLERIEEMDLEKSLVFYQDRFSDAGDFIFIFVGNIDFEILEPLVNRYLGSLPSTGREESWRDIGLETPKGVIKRTVHKGLEPQSQVAIVFSGPFVYSQMNRTALRAMSMTFQTRLREMLREELGGTYGVQVNSNYYKIPEEEYSLTINFATDPNRIQEMLDAVFAEIANIRNQGPSEKEVQDIQEAFMREYETQSRQNPWLLAQLEHKYRLGEDPRGILTYIDSIKALSPEILKKAAERYLDTGNYVQVVLMPDKKTRLPLTWHSPLCRHNKVKAK
jgi:zinc protease